MKGRCNWIVLIILVFIIFSNCSYKIDTSFYGYEISFTLKEKLLRIQDSTTISLNLADVNDSSFTVIWSTNNGYIKGTGSKVKYYAPDHKGLVKIKAEIIDRNKNIYFDSINIIIYKQLIFLKADDLRFDTSNIVSKNWRSFIDFVELEKIKASLGLIGNSLENGNTSYYSYLKELAASGYFEIWNHGYNHLLSGINENGEQFQEFCNTSYEYQKEHLLKTQSLAKEKLNIILHTFGAPGNFKDSNTLKTVEEINDIKVWYFGLENYSKLNLMRLAEIEFPYFHPDFQKFQTNYDAQQCCLTFQIHPDTWDENRLSEFKKIINYLKQEDVTFMTPYEYYELMN